MSVKECDMFLLRHERSGEYVKVIRADGVLTTEVGKRAIHFADESVAQEQADALNLKARTSFYRVIVAQMTGVL